MPLNKYDFVCNKKKKPSLLLILFFTNSLKKKQKNMLVVYTRLFSAPISGRAVKAAPDYFLLAQLAQLSHTPNGERTTHAHRR